MNNRYDVFISYSHNDIAWVRDVLVPYLESHHFIVAVDYRDFQGGAFSIDEMERCVIESRHLIAVFSQAYFNSDWGKLENVMAQTQDPGATQRKLVPILMQDCSIPLRLSIINYIDLRKDEALKWNMLIQSLI